MNLALSAVLLAILLAPPLVFVFFYQTGRHAKAAPKLSLVEYLLISAVLSLPLHAGIVEVFNLPVDQPFILKLLSGTLTEKYVDDLKNNTIKSYLSGFTKYIVILTIGCAILGYVSQLIVRMKWIRGMAWLQSIREDGKPILFPYYNDWWYFFRGHEYNRDYSIRSKSSDYYTIFVDVLTDTKDATIIYRGILKDFVTVGTNLDRVYLSSPTKKFFLKRREEDDLLNSNDTNFQETDLLCISISNSININVNFGLMKIMKKNNQQLDLTEDQLDMIIGKTHIPNQA